jgi:hypothetical protein
VTSQVDACTSLAYACMYFMHCPMTSQADACSYCMGSVVLISSHYPIYAIKNREKRLEPSPSKITC